MPNESNVSKLTIASVDDTGLTVVAQYNPKEVQIEKSVPWQKHPSSKGDEPDLEFTGAEGRSMSVELLFDGYETNTDVHTTYVDKLLTMAKAKDHRSNTEHMRRPHKIAVSWGDAGLPRFIGVIESLSTKYTMFDPKGKPIRATVNVKFKEAQGLSSKSGG